MKDLFNSDFFSGNRQNLKESRSTDVPIVLTANGAVQRAGDSPFRFRQDSSFWYLTGLEEAELVLVITGTTEFIILPERSAILDVFDGTIDTDELTKRSGIEKIYDHQAGWEQLRSLAVKYKKLYTGLYKGYDERHNIYNNPSKPRLVAQLKKLHSDITLLDIRRELAHLRMVKQEPEIAAIQQAIDITAKSLESVFKDGWSKKYKTEADLEREVTYEFARNGSKIHAYPPIIASGKNGCTLHYMSNDQTVNLNELLLIDAGAEYSNYAADITRVYAPGAPTERQQAVYDAVLAIQKYTIGLLKPGVMMRDIEDKVEREIGRHLKTLGLIKKIDSNLIRKYYPHSFSHHLGLDVHDVADYSVALKAGNVITVEPGIYIEEENIGVRIEDDVLITEKGCKVLSADLPSRLRSPTIKAKL